MRPAERVKFAIGLMSGTSRDGVDAALIKTDGLGHVEPVAFWFKPYSAGMKSLIADACDIAMSRNKPGASSVVDQCLALLNEQYLVATRTLIEHAGVRASDVTVIGLHGHTIAHRADLGWTWQIGDPQFLANELNVDVVSDMRRHDVMFGGQGAPLIPVFHRALFSAPGEDIAVLNLGGVANLTFLGRNGELVAFDCGMASALIDDWIAQKTNYEFDEGGGFAAQGSVDEAILANMLAHPFFSSASPKSLDRKDFEWTHVADLHVTDGAATLTAFSAKAVAIGLAQLPRMPLRLIVCGGGRKNKTLLDMIEKYSGLTLVTADELGWDGDAVEAQGFAYIAYRCLYGLPITYPGTTGVTEPMSGGVITKPRAYRARMVMA